MVCISPGIQIQALIGVTSGLSGVPEMILEPGQKVSFPWILALVKDDQVMGRPWNHDCHLAWVSGMGHEAGVLAVASEDAANDGVALAPSPLPSSKHSHLALLFESVLGFQLGF